MNIKTKIKKGKKLKKPDVIFLEIKTKWVKVSTFSRKTTQV